MSAKKRNTIHVTILGIDGSGKSTITAALAALVSAELQVVAGSSGDTFQVVTPDEDLLAPNFSPDGFVLSAYLSKWFKRQAKRFVDNRKVYPFFKLSQMIFQDHATVRLGKRYHACIFFSDGNTLLSATGRAANYLRAASNQTAMQKTAPVAEDLAAVYRYIVDGVDVPVENRSRLPSLKRGRRIYKMLSALGVRGVWLPNLVILIDVLPEVALTRIARRPKVDLHENLADLQQAREMYQKTIDAFRQYRSQGTAHVISTDRLSPGEIVRRILEIIRPHVVADDLQHQTGAPLGTSTEELSGGGAWKKILSYRYIVRYLLAKFFQHAWREPIFVFSRIGKLFLKEGYSAAVMRAIYDQDQTEPGMLDRIFLQYPLHRAVYDRLQILTKKIEPILERELIEKTSVSIFTAPSGFAYDLLRPLESIARRNHTLMARVHFTAGDLDPHDYLAGELASRANDLGISFRFFRGNLGDPDVRRSFEQTSPFDLALFVGLSAWLPKPLMLDHLRWIRRNLCNDGFFVTDSFTPEAYALSGKFAGYKANYYQPSVFQVLLDECGFDGLNAEIESGQDKINHVYVVAAK